MENSLFLENIIKYYFARYTYIKQNFYEYIQKVKMDEYYIPKDFPRELLQKDIFDRSYEELLTLCLHKESRIRSICKEKWFWLFSLKSYMEKKGLTPKKAFKKSCKKDRRIFVAYLVKYHNVNPSLNKNFAIKYAIKKKNYNLLKLLLSFDNISADGHLMEKAIKKDQIEIVKILLESGKYTPLTIYDKYPYLTFAIWYNRYDIVKLMLSFIENDEIPEGINMLSLAASKGLDKIVKLLLKDGRINPILEDYITIRKACDNNQDKIVKILLMDERVSNSDLKMNKEILECLEKL